MRIVLNTNVVIASLLSGSGSPAHTLSLVLNRSVTPLLDHRILAEYHEVATRSAFSFSRPLVDAVLARISEVAEHITALPLKLALPDPDDRCFVEVAVAGRADAVVTGNLKHFVPKNRKLTVPILTPRQFLDRLRR
ncbi:MAG: putative toxin-antitoxin system toxin component, PIN family [Gemmatimonadaceae bacterium]